jgi:hypothetical protein
MERIKRASHIFYNDILTDIEVPDFLKRISPLFTSLSSFVLVSMIMIVIDLFCFVDVV